MENQLELAISGPRTSYQELIESQKELFRSQVHELHNIVFAQCKLTGINPLSQEMAAGALSIKIGKRPRDLLNPKAVKYMQSVFSIKDAISKKETREISALFGVTVTQVREFFTTQRSRVRKFVRLSREKANKSSTCNNVVEGVLSSSDLNAPIDTVPLDSVAPISTEEAPSPSAQDEILAGVDESDKHFLEHIFSLMRKEETFSGQVKLMEWILQIQNPSVLYWFLTKGGVMILATWLSQAAMEEQTSVLHITLKIIRSDISNRARILLARWSKVFARSQAVKKANGMKSACSIQDEMLLRQSINEVMGNGSWDSTVDSVEETPSNMSESMENLRKLESSQPLKMLTATADDSNKKLGRGVLSSQTRERRKVQLMEQPGQKTAGRSPQVARPSKMIQGRPLSADDIQKAKLRAQLMQSKHGKAGDGNTQVKPEGPKKCSSSRDSTFLSAPKVHVRPNSEGHKKLDDLSLEKTSHPEMAVNCKMILDTEEPPWKRYKRVQIPWQMPPEVKMGESWRVAAGESSKEVEVQKNRIHRERETIYRTLQEIPSDPKEPWDREMDYDDTLTPEIPTEQLPDSDSAAVAAVGAAMQMEASTQQGKEVANSSSAGTSSQNGNGSMPAPDFELLAALLKNPELVYALTSSGGSSLSNEDTVRLLDMIKANGASSSSSSLAALDRNTEKKVEVSLPSPTPPSEAVTNGERRDLGKNPFLRQNIAIGRDGLHAGVASTSTSTPEKLLASSSVRAQIPAMAMLATAQSAQQTVPKMSLLQANTGVLEQRLSPLVSSFSHNAPPNPSHRQIPASDLALNVNHVSSLASPGLVGAATPAMGFETSNSLRPLSVSMDNTGRPVGWPLPSQVSIPTLSRPPMQLQQSFRTEPLHSHSWRSPAPNTYYQEHPNPNNYNAFVGGPSQTPSQPGRHWNRSDTLEEVRFESWSPENSPTSSHEYAPIWHQPEPRMNINSNFRPEGSQTRNPGYTSRSRDPIWSKVPENRWHDRRR